MHWSYLPPTTCLFPVGLSSLDWRSTSLGRRIWMLSSGGSGTPGTWRSTSRTWSRYKLWIRRWRKIRTRTKSCRCVTFSHTYQTHTFLHMFVSVLEGCFVRLAHLLFRGRRIDCHSCICKGETRQTSSALHCQPLPWLGANDPLKWIRWRKV